MLVNQRITLVSPDLWEDRNDTVQLGRFREMHGFGFVGALCLTGAAETYHHWKIFADGIDGVCVEFDRDELSRFVKPHANVRMKAVKYVKVADISNSKMYPIGDLPFYKRWGFAAEEEVRIIHTSADELSFYHIPIDVSCIKRIVTSPFLPEPLLNGIVKTIQSIDLCSVIKVHKSRLIESDTWRKKWASRIKRT